MSYELDYFPPNGTKWKWGTKVLQSREWNCLLHQQVEPDLSLWPLSVRLWVDLIQGEWKWHVDVTEFDFRQYRIEGVAESALDACLTAERTGEAKMQELLPDWVRTALAHRWRPPA